MTIKEVLEYANTVFELHQIEDAKRESELLVQRICGLSSAYIRFHAFESLSEEQQRELMSAIERRSTHEPLAYIIGAQDFYGRTFQVNPAVLIPRPETEELIDLALKYTEQKELIMDIGTGSGVIGITMGLECPTLPVYCFDVSEDALVVARENAGRVAKQKQNIDFFHIQSCKEAVEKIPFDINTILIIANLPYIATDEMASLDKNVYAFEPHLALDGGPEGTVIIYELLDALSASLQDHTCRYTVLLEIDERNIETINRWVNAHSQYVKEQDAYEDLNQQKRFYRIEMGNVG